MLLPGLRRAKAQHSTGTSRDAAGRAIPLFSTVRITLFTLTVDWLHVTEIFQFNFSQFKNCSSFSAIRAVHHDFP
jgi:hypothetical protein